MTTIRSSVRPTTTKLPWGTILKPEFGLGHQKMTEYEIDQTVNRLYYVPQTKERPYARAGKSMSPEEIEDMLKRLTHIKKSKIPDSDRRVTSSQYRTMGVLERLTKKENTPDSDRRVTASPINRMGVVSSYAWQGYNGYL